MNDRDRRRYEMLQRVKQFGIDNATDFPGTSVGGQQFATVTARVADIDDKGADQLAGFGTAAQQFEVKGTNRENVRDLMSDISRTAWSMEYAFDGIADLFRMPRNTTDQTLLAAARAFYTDSEENELDFVAYGLDAGFRDALNSAADAFEATFGTTATATDTHVAATAEISELIRLGMVAVRILDGVVRNKYASNTGKLAAWLSASHVEKDPKKKDPPTP